jgi:hydroxyacylglutathione hydrolase
MTKDAFIKELTTGIQAPPQYFFHDVAMNKGKVEPVDDVLKKGLVYVADPDFDDLAR